MVECPKCGSIKIERIDLKYGEYHQFYCCKCGLEFNKDQDINA